MFEFFLALFGGAYYATKAAHERGKNAIAKQSSDERNACRIRLKTDCTVSYEVENQIKNYILCGTYYEEICNKFQTDFEYVFGSDWRNQLVIPPIPLTQNKYLRNAALKKGEIYSFDLPGSHLCWVYRLILAKQGKVDHWMLSFGYGFGGVAEEEMCEKFMLRIAQHLKNAVVHEQLAVDFEDSSKISSVLKFRSLCVYKAQSLDDYIDAQKKRRGRIDSETKLFFD